MEEQANDPGAQPRRPTSSAPLAGSTPGTPAQGSRLRGHLPPPPASPAPVRLTQSAENQVGKYLLSGAAALLVLLSGATLVAMWWDTIPDLVKVSAVFVIGVLLTALGTWLALRHRGNALHAATVTGIGGGLGFVGLMGAALLHLVPSVASFVALSAWTLVMLGLAARTRLVFTIIVAALGGVATTLLAAGQVAENPTEALLALLLMVAYAASTCLTSAVVVRFVPRDRVPLHLIAPLVLIVATAALVPIEAS
ncbi:Uncharacterised protein [Propionibacterium australiense]|uniref:Uncharacterized protein n=1 Tax=Propionibacterium australiense TaxID=119981 RepID=A0A383S3D1_9ACTN|nr:Hypothetical protein PROPAUS_0240 [Propionibacterium australiense]VEH90363.1 Uncharacterised protein [Propionibacterium australiense]